MSKRRLDKDFEMAAKNTSNSESKGDTKKIKKDDSSKIPAIEDQDSLYYEKGLLELSSENLNEVKFQADVGNKVDSDLGKKCSTPSIKVMKTTTAVNIPTNITIKREIITCDEESESKVPVYTPTPIVPPKAMNEEAVEQNSINPTGAKEVSSDGDKKECNNVIRLAAKVLSDAERKQLRAKRFNIIVADSGPNAKKTLAKKVPTPVEQSAPGSANQPTPTYDILKKRAERFGENVSTVMKSLDYKEKMLKRKLKFLESVTNLKELEIKKRRAERFRMV